MSERPGVLPNFLIIGAEKAGTTSLYNYLRHHPQVFMAQSKELEFFIERENWSRGIEWYKANFRDATSAALAIGEASTGYSSHPALPGVPARIAATLPRVRLIYLVRNPVERAISAYFDHVRRGSEHKPIERALLSDPRYVDRSRYAMQIERYLERFPREQLLIIKSEDLRIERVKTLKRIYDFLGVDSTWVPPSVHREFNKTSDSVRHQLVRSVRRRPLVRATKGYAPKSLRKMIRGILVHVATYRRRQTVISPDVVWHLQEQVREDVRRLRQYMNGDFDGWGIA